MRGMVEFTRKLSVALIDLSGTLHVENEATPNAVTALNKLKSKDLRIRFVTNTTKESKHSLHNRLTRLGFNIKKEEIFSSLTAAHNIIVKEKLHPYLLIDDAAMEDFKDVMDFEGPPNAVVIGLAPDKFTRQNLNTAFRLLLEGARFIAIHEGRYYRSRKGLALGPGPFIKMLEYATNVKPTVVGKPNPDFFLAALDGVPVNQAVIIGDDVRDDIQGAQKLGIYGILVKTGKYRAGDECAIPTPPNDVVDTFDHAVAKIITNFDL